MIQIRPITWALLGGLGVWAVWDIVCVSMGYPGTISRVVWENMGRFPFISFLTGVAVGHLFWPQFRAKPWVEVTGFGFFMAFMTYFYWSQHVVAIAKP